MEPISSSERAPVLVTREELLDAYFHARPVRDRGSGGSVHTGVEAVAEFVAARAGLALTVEGGYLQRNP